LPRGRRTKTAQARTRGDAATVYGDFSFRARVMMAGPGRRCCRQKLGESDFAPCGVGIGPDAKFADLVTICGKGVCGGIGRNGRVSA
jgi:hypothetical protein